MTSAPRTIDDHVKRRQLELAANIESRKKVYLDLRFWIIARNADDGTDTSAVARKFLHLLRRGVRSGAIICPTSESTVLEVMKQANTRTRRQATAHLVDELSLGVSLIHGRRRVATEIAYFFHRFGPSGDLHPQAQLVWTKISNALGELFPHLDGLDDAAQLAHQAAFFDHMWGKGLVDLLEAIGDAEHPDADLQRAAGVVADGIREHAPTLVSYEQTYRDEVVGAIDGYGACTGDIMASLAEKAGAAPVPSGSPEWEAAVIGSKNLLVAAMEKPEVKAVLRTIHSLACLHAGLRWDRKTKFTANHFYDFDHAAGAVAYCDAFLTEGFLAHVANANHVRLYEVNGCRTTADLHEAVEVVRSFV